VLFRSADVTRQDWQEINQKRCKAESVKSDPEPHAVAADLRHFVKDHQDHEKTQENNRAGPRGALEIKDHVSTEQTPEKKMHDLNLIFPRPCEESGKAQAMDGLPILKKEKEAEQSDKEELKKEF